MTPDSLRWRDYFLRGGEHFDEFWKPFLSERKRNLLFVLGHGFDTRMCDGIERVMALGGEGTRDVALISFDEGPESPSNSYAPQRKANGARLEKLVQGRGHIGHRTITMFSDERRRIGARSIAQEFQSPAEFRSYTDVVVDISALPRGLYLPLLVKFLNLFDAESIGGEKRNLHVIVSHSPSTDGAIIEEGLDESASYLYGFAAAALESDSTSDQPMIWIPVLGKRQKLQLEKIHSLVSPDEICPLLPSPSQDPREGDALVIEYRDLLFDQLRVEPRNIIYAAESNPFEVYRQLMRSIRHYQRALNPLGGCKVALSAMSSKLASIGVLLAAYELGRRDPKVTVGVAHVESQGYRVVPASTAQLTTMFTMWLSGECYAT
ncbi:hypothetical protein ACJ2CR_19425 [Myxococcus faecalis]|uniref:hypothetical protein n=1 Tax=Myxococcus faecalis TaxID=3115646 RepID=UPI0038CF3E79